MSGTSDWPKIDIDGATFCLRPMGLTDVNYVRGAWYPWLRTHSKSLRKAHMPHTDGGPYRALVNLLVSQCKVRVLCSASTPDTLCGFIASLGHDVMWIYVAQDFRGRGLSKWMREHREKVSEAA